MTPTQQPYIKPEQTLAEITLKSVFLGITLSMIMAGANAYLGLFAGMTVSASIPAAVISMAILRFFKNANILENNCVQTAASAGESLSAGVIFTFPALVLMGYWQEFNYWETTLIAGCGGVLGVLFTIPLRRALIVEQKLQFPEGVATSEVLKSGEEGGKSVIYLAVAALTGALFKFFSSGAKIWTETFDKAALVGGKGFVYFGMNLSPALMAVGYIVGINIAVLVFLGGVISWWVAIPIYVAFTGNPENLGAIDLGYTIWSTKIRYLGVGAMIVGGLWAVISIRKSLLSAFKHAMDAFRKNTSTNTLPRTEKDTPMSWVVLAVFAMIIPIFIIYLREIGVFNVSVFMAIVMVFSGFLFSAVAGYMAGLVGSSNNPISGVTIGTILTASLLLLLLIGTEGGKGAPAAILIGAVVCCAAAIAGDNMQDLKAGHLLGATPYKQQIMQIIGTLSGALVMAPVLNLLLTAYGFGAKTAAHPDALAAPQATLMQSVAQGVFGGNLPWDFIAVGVLIGIVIIATDRYLERKNKTFRMPILAVAVGLYLPFELDSAIMLGGILSWILARFQKQHSSGKSKEEQESAVKRSDHTGLLFASGLITGEALIGILIAIPIAVTGSGEILQLMSDPIGSWPGLVLLIGICAWLVHLSKKSYFEKVAP